MLNRQRGIIPISLIFYGLAALAIIGALYGVYKWIDTTWETTAGIDRGTKDKQAEWDKANEDQRKREAAQSAEASTQVEVKSEKAKVVYRTITQSVDKIIDRPIYRNVCFDDIGLRDANAALSGQIAPAGEPDRAVPSPKPTTRWDGGSGAEKTSGG